MTQAAFDDIFAEVKKAIQRLECIEKALASMMTMLMPEEEIREEERKELDTIEAEMKSGQSVSLDELEKKNVEVDANHLHNIVRRASTAPRMGPRRC